MRFRLRNFCFFFISSYKGLLCKFSVLGFQEYLDSRQWSSGFVRWLYSRAWLSWDLRTWGEGMPKWPKVPFGIYSAHNSIQSSLRSTAGIQQSISHSVLSTQIKLQNKKGLIIYHIWIIPVTRTGVAHDHVLIVPIVVDYGLNALPRVLNVIKISPKVTSRFDRRVIWLPRK